MCRARLFFALRAKLSGVALVFAVRTKLSSANVSTFVGRETRSVTLSGSVVIFSHFALGKQCSSVENLFVRGL